MTTSILNMTDYTVKLSEAAEWALCARYGIERTKHDSKPYDEASDVDAGDVRISVKTSSFTLMAGSRCEGRKDFDAIWELYAAKVHSNWFAYVTQDGICYMMSLDEFKELVYMFCMLTRDSTKNGGLPKIQARKETKKMRKWLAERAA